MHFFLQHTVYLDNSSTTKPCKTAVRYINKALTAEWGNPSSLHRLGMEAEIALSEARETVARSVSARADEIIFTGSGTEANNTSLLSCLKAKKRGGIPAATCRALFIPSQNSNEIQTSAAQALSEAFFIANAQTATDAAFASVMNKG